MAQWRKTFFSLGGPENIADPAAEEALRFGQLLMAKRQQQQALGMERERLGFDQQRHADALRAAGEERLFERQKDQRNFGASREDALLQRGFATSGRDRQTMEADRDYQQRVADMQARREAEAAARALQERTIGGQEQERLMRRESEQDARAREERYRQEDLARRAAERKEDRGYDEQKDLRAEARRQQALGQELAASAQADVRRMGAEAAERQRQDAAVAEQNRRVETEDAAEVAEQARKPANLAALVAAEGLRGLSNNPYKDPFFSSFGPKATASNVLREAGTESTVPFTEAGWFPAIFGPRKEVAMAKDALTSAVRGSAEYGIATDEEKAALEEVLVNQIDARIRALAETTPGDSGELDALRVELFQHLARELASLRTVPAAKSKAARSKPPRPPAQGR